MAVHLVRTVPDVARRGHLDLLGSVLLESIQKEESCQEMANTSPSAEALQSPDYFSFYQSVCFLSTSLTQESAAYCEPVSGGKSGRRGSLVTDWAFFSPLGSSCPSC